MKNLSFLLIALNLLASPLYGLAQDQPPPPPDEPGSPGTPPAPTGKDAEEVEVVTDVKEVTGDPLFNPEMFPALERINNLLDAHTTRRNALLISVDHRTYQKFTEATFRDWFGLDAGSLKIGIGARYGILDNLDAGFLRLNGTAEIFDTYQFDARYAPLNQDDHFVNLAVRAGLSWFYQPGKADAVGFFGQLLVDRIFFNRWKVGAGLLYHSNSSGEEKSNLDPDYSLAVAAWTEIRILSFLAWNLEIAAPVAGFRDNLPGKSSNWAWTSAVKLILHRHVFSLLLTNTQYLAADGVVAGTHRNFSDLIVGFTILREFDF
jgi:hypothetical protein